MKQEYIEKIYAGWYAKNIGIRMVLRTARDLAYKVHTELGDKFIRAVNAKTKRTVGSDYILQDGDDIRIVANR